MSTLLPQEILDHVIDHLYDDKATLMACSFASKSLSDASYHHLFHSVFVKMDQDLEVDHTVTVFRKFFAFVSSPTSRANRYIRRLSIESGPNDSAYSRFFAPSFQDIRGLLSCLPSLQSLELRRIRVNPSAVDIIQPPGGRDTQITYRLRSLTFWRCIFEDIPIALPEFLQLTKPHKVSLNNPRRVNVDLEQNHDHISPSASIPRANPSSSVRIENLLFIGRWKLMVRDNNREIELIEHVLHCISHNGHGIHSLRELTFLIGTWPNNPHYYIEKLRGLFLSVFKHTSSLTSFVIGISYGYSFSSNSWSQWLSILSSLPHNTQHIRFEILAFDAIDAASASLPDPAVLRANLLQLASLRTFTLRWGLSEVNMHNGVGDILASRLHELLPDLATRGIVRTEACIMDELHKSSGVPVAEANSPTWLNRPRMGWD
ncbi:hypothetical protein QCA50_003407 [Cerrena zonata]|uniref:F-box domain-containing protein n=1 Tax=Cerrena zonata TaxID=2478898 RepID=A0AAW0GWA6_9APHY